MNKHQKLQAFRRRAALIKWNKARHGIGEDFSAYTLDADEFMSLTTKERMEFMKQSFEEAIATEAMRLIIGDNTSSLAH